MTKKNSCGSKIPLPPKKTFLMVRPLSAYTPTSFVWIPTCRRFKPKFADPCELWTVAWQRSSAFKTIIVFQTKKYDKHWVFVFFEFILSLWGVDSAKKISRKRLGCISKYSLTIWLFLTSCMLHVKVYLTLFEWKIYLWVSFQQEFMTIKRII